MMFNHKRTLGMLAACLGFALLGGTVLLQAPEKLQRHSVIVQGANLQAVKLAVQSVGGEVSHELGIIKAVSANLTDAQMEKLRAIQGIRRVYANSGVDVSLVTPPPPSQADPAGHIPDYCGAARAGGW